MDAHVKLCDPALTRATCTVGIKCYKKISRLLTDLLPDFVHWSISHAHLLKTMLDPLQVILVKHYESVFSGDCLFTWFKLWSWTKVSRRFMFCIN